LLEIFECKEASVCPNEVRESAAMNEDVRERFLIAFLR
jgi:hypothetical protein